MRSVSFLAHADKVSLKLPPLWDKESEGVCKELPHPQHPSIPSSITKSTDGTLFGLKALTKLTCPTAVVPTIEGWGDELTSDEIYAQCTLYVQEELVEAFKQSSTWKSFHAILPIPKPFEADLSMTVATNAAFSISVGAEGDAVTVHYPDGFQETKVGADGALTPAFDGWDNSCGAGELR